MAERRYYYIKNYSSHGEMAINYHVFEAIALNTIKKIKGVKIYKKTHNNKLYRPIVCEMKRNGPLKIKADIVLKKGVNLKKTCEEIQHEISNAILLAIETVQVEVNLNVASVEE